MARGSFPCSWVNHQTGVQCDRLPFGTSQQLETHMNAHMRLKPYGCRIDDCPKSFGDSSGRSKHEKTHGVPRYQCVYDCNGAFTRQDQLKRHVKWKWNEGKRTFNEPACRNLKPSLDSRNYQVFDWTKDLDMFGVPLTFQALLDQLVAAITAGAAPGVQLAPNTAPVQAQQQQPLPPLLQVSVPAPPPQQQPLVPAPGYPNFGPALPAPGVLQNQSPYGQQMEVGIPVQQQNFGTDQYPAPPQEAALGPDIDVDMYTEASPMRGTFGAPPPPPQQYVSPQDVFGNPALTPAASFDSLRSNETYASASSQGSYDDVPQAVDDPLPQEAAVEKERVNVFDERQDISGNNWMDQFLGDDFRDPTGRERGY